MTKEEMEEEEEAEEEEVLVHDFKNKNWRYTYFLLRPNWLFIVKMYFLSAWIRLNLQEELDPDDPNLDPLVKKKLNKVRGSGCLSVRVRIYQFRYYAY